MQTNLASNFSHYRARRAECWRSFVCEHKTIPLLWGALDLQRTETETETSPTGSRDYQTTVSTQTTLFPDHGVSFKLTPVCICRWDRSRGPQRGTNTPTGQVCRDNKLLTWSRWFYTSGIVAHRRGTAQTSPSLSQSLPARVTYQSPVKKWLL